MNKKDHFLIKEKEAIIEEKRLEIKKVKKERTKLRNKIDIVGNLYEYLVTPICAISISLVALLSGPIIYVLPTITAVGAISVVSYKFFLRKKMDKLDSNIQMLKKERQDAYNSREVAYENVFNDLRAKGMDVNDYYHQIVNASSACDKLTKSMEPHKQKKSKLEKIRNVISGLFDYSLAPIAAVVLPLVCAFVDVGTVGEIAIMSTSSAVLLGCATADDKLTKKIDEIEDTISDIKSDRTVKYVKRDLKLNEALRFLQSTENKMMNRTIAKDKKAEKKHKVSKR